ncbi:sodium-coupled monocarboxylate transporter 1-like [Mytilus californianus]|uniref:sodium-coupled monocarboxylate transporter 1-like n=1 Tax=Mytilus californianus TaxID=6549 RepID=UPI002245E738|nr:sodium-coupled monocarboxylate transporter 1-like [Mytilus californianus]
MWNRTYLYNFETGTSVYFHTYDYVVFGITLGLSASIGLFYAIKDRKKKSENEFLLAGRNMSVLPVALSLMSSFISAVTLLGTPAEMYRYNTMYWFIVFGFLISVILSNTIFIPVFYNLGITSVFEYIHLRFGTLVRIISCIIYMITMLIYMAIVLYGPSLALNAVTGIDLWGSLVAICAVCTLYTALGGMKAVVWTDTVQVLIMFAGMLILLIFGCRKLGGLDVAWRVADQNDRIKFLILNPDPSERHSLWNMIVGGGFIWTGVYGINQAQVQRAVSFSSLARAKLSLWVNLVCIVSILSLVCLVGVVMFAYYSTCDPVKAGIVTKSDQLIPLFAMDIVGKYHGLPGLVISCIFSGSLSSVSSGFNAISAIILKDFILVCAPNMPSGTRTIISKFIVLLTGGVCLAVAYVMSLLTSSILTATITIYGLLGGPLLGLFTLGILFPWANKWGGLFGLLSSLVVNCWIGFGAFINKVVVTPTSPVTTEGCRLNLTTIEAITNITSTTPSAAIEKQDDYLIIYKMSYIWFTGLGLLVCVVFGLIVSFITGATDPKKINPGLICPIFDEILPCLPVKTRKRLHFGVRHEDFVKFSKDNPKTIERGGYDRTLYIAENTDKIPHDAIRGFPKHFEKSEYNTKL